MYVDPTGEIIWEIILGVIIIGGAGLLMTSCETTSSSAKPAAPNSSSQTSYGSDPEYHSVKSVPCDSYDDGLSKGFNYVYENSKMYHWHRETAVAIWYCSSTDSYSVEYYEGIGGCTCSLIPIPSSPDYTVVATIHSHPSQELDAIYGWDWKVYENGYDKKIEMYVMDYNFSMKYLRITYLPRDVAGIDRAKIYWDGVIE